MIMYIRYTAVLWPLLCCLNFQVPIKVVQGKLYVRVSAHVYNELADYQVLADAVLQILQNTAQQCQ